MWSTRYSWWILMKLEFSRQIFEKSWNVKFHNILSLGAELFSADRQTGGKTDDDAFRNFANAPKIYFLVPESSVGFSIDQPLQVATISTELSPLMVCDRLEIKTALVENAVNFIVTVFRLSFDAIQSNAAGSNDACWSCWSLSTSNPAVRLQPSLLPAT